MIGSTQGSGLPSIWLVPGWLTTASHWTGPHGLLVSLREQVLYTVIAVGAAMIVAIPAGLVLGHTGRGSFAVAGLANGLRAVPAFGLMILLYVIVSPTITYRGSIGWLVPRGALGSLLPVEAMLAVLAVPPILTNTYAGVRDVDPAIRDAAQGMGMNARQVVWRVEAPMAMPLIVAGIRSAVLQVIATATIAGFLPFLGGLGYQIFINGLPQINDPNVGYPAVLGAALLVAILAGAADLSLMAAGRVIVSPGLTRRRSQPAKSSMAAAKLHEATPVPQPQGEP